MTRPIGIAGGLRAGSYNAGLLRAATQLMPATAALDTATSGRVPLYDVDAEATDGIAAVVTALKDRVATAGGRLLVAPE